MQRYSNAIQALVYAGAAFLVVIVGLRGLGDLSAIESMPKWLLDESTGRLSVNIVMIGLVAEFAILMAFAALFFKTPAQFTVNDAKAFIATTVASDDVSKLVESERAIIESLGKRIETLIDSERRIGIF
jgi:hypothetical protein